jgi:uncharacterized protein (TIGR02453 family)
VKAQGQSLALQAGKSHASSSPRYSSRVAAYFSPALFAFLSQLKKHNDRGWFQEHRARYVAEVETPLLAFIGDLAPRMRAISPAFIVDPKRTGGSMFRIYRDTRFSQDKSPYKTHVAAMFAHRERKKSPSVPGFYLHLEPGDSMGGGGIYHPDSPTLNRIRLAIVENPRRWAAVKRTGLPIEGASLTRGPAGFDPAHPFIEDLRKKDLYGIVEFTEKDVCSPRFLDRYVESCARAAPLVEFVTKALGWTF